MRKKFNESHPADYPVCMHAYLSMAEACLHQITYLALLAREEILHLANQNDCTHFPRITILFTLQYHTGETPAPPVINRSTSL